MLSPEGLPDHKRKGAAGAHLQAVQAVNTFNGEEIAGRKILVREDREDRDVKQYNKDHGIERPEGARPPRRGRRGAAQQSQRGPKDTNGETEGAPVPEPSGLQVRVTASSLPDLTLRQMRRPLARLLLPHVPCLLGDTGWHAAQVVVQGIPWKFRDEDLAALFEDCGPVEESKVVISKDGRSRVSATLACPGFLQPQTLDSLEIWGEHESAFFCRAMAQCDSAPRTTHQRQSRSTMAQTLRAAPSLSSLTSASCRILSSHSLSCPSTTAAVSESCFPSLACLHRCDAASRCARHQCHHVACRFA